MTHRKWPLILIALVVAAPAAAQDKSADADTVAFVRKTFDAGLVAYSSGNYDEAKRLFLQAYKIKPTANITYNLARTELKLGSFVDAARHLATCIRSDDAKQSLRNSARDALQEAEQRVGKLKIDVNVDGADVLVDAESFGPSPIPGQTAYVSPGRHALLARKSGFADASHNVDVQAGQTVTVMLKVAAAGERPEQGSSRTLTTPSSSIPMTSATPTDRSTLVPGVEEGRSARSVLLWTGAGLTVASFGVAAVFALKGSAARSDADGTLADISARFGSYRCSDPAATQPCAQLDDQLAKEHDAHRIANVALWGGVLVGAATAAAFVLWKPDNHATQSTLTLSGNGLWLSGRF